MEDAHAALFPDGPPKPRTLDELKAGLRAHILRRHGRARQVRSIDTNVLVRLLAHDDPAPFAAAGDGLLDHRDLVLQDADAVVAALADRQRRPNLGFTGCLVLALARKAGHLPLAIFDGAFAKLAGAQPLRGSSRKSGPS